MDKKTKYVKNNFFDIVYPDGRLSGRNNYCITAINRALIDANVCGDLNNVLPEYDSEGFNAVECRRFVSHLKQKGFGDCIRSGSINVRELEIGDIVMTPRGGGRYHATTYIGNGKVRSFNNDGEWNLQKRTGIVIKTREITEKAIKLELERQQLITPEKNGRQIIPLPKAQKMMQILYNGRDPRNHTAQMLLQKRTTGCWRTFRPTTPSSAVSTRYGKSETPSKYRPARPELSLYKKGPVSDGAFRHIPSSVQKKKLARRLNTVP